MAMNRNLAVSLFTLAGLVAGIFLGWLFFAPSKPKNGTIASTGGAGAGNGNGGTVNGNGGTNGTPRL